VEIKECTPDPFAPRPKYTSDLKGLNKQGPYTLLKQDEEI